MVSDDLPAIGTTLMGEEGKLLSVRHGRTVYYPGG